MLLINELPDDCLITIFNAIYDLDDLLACFKVCYRWSWLISYRMFKIRYMTVGKNCVDCPELDSIYFNHNDSNQQLINTLLPNLKIIDLTRFSIEKFNNNKEKDNSNESFNVPNIEKIKGLIYEPFTFSGQKNFDHFKSLEMVAAPNIDTYLIEGTLAGPKIVQLCLSNYYLDTFKEVGHHFVNLKRLHIHKHVDYYDSFYDGPVLPKLEILELSISSFHGYEPYVGFNFMDSCPYLKSAYHEIGTMHVCVNDSIINKNLQDLVLNYRTNCEPDWNSLKTMMMKYPNLKHLSLRNNQKISDDNIIELIRLLVKLVLLDLRGSSGISSALKDTVDNYCIRSGRTVKIYYKPEDDDLRIKSDWPNLSFRYRRIVKGFDFMRHCFLKPFYDLPRLMDPMDDSH